MRSLLLFSMISASVGCGVVPVTVVRLAPAEIPVPAGKTIAVATLRGPGGGELATDLTAALVAMQRFQVVERQKLDALMAELKFSADGHVSDDSAMTFGEMTGAKVLLVGEVVHAEYREQVSTSTQSCMAQGTTHDCLVHTRSAAQTLRVSLEVVETESGKVLAAKTLDAQKARSAQTTDAPPPPPLDAERELATQCRADVVAAFMRVIAPHEVQVTVYLRTDDDLPELEAGHNHAKLGRWDDAIAQYRAAVARSAGPTFTPEQRAIALYALGVGLGYSGAYEEGIDALERAYVTDPDDVYRKEVERVRGFRADDARLAEQQQAQ